MPQHQIVHYIPLPQQQQPRPQPIFLSPPPPPPSVLGFPLPTVWSVGTVGQLLTAIGLFFIACALLLLPTRARLFDGDQQMGSPPKYGPGGYPPQQYSNGGGSNGFDPRDGYPFGVGNPFGNGYAQPPTQHSPYHQQSRLLPQSAPRSDSNPHAIAGCCVPQHSPTTSPPDIYGGPSAPFRNLVTHAEAVQNGYSSVPIEQGDRTSTNGFAPQPPSRHALPPSTKEIHKGFDSLQRENEVRRQRQTLQPDIAYMPADAAAAAKAGGSVQDEDYYVACRSSSKTLSPSLVKATPEQILASREVQQQMLSEARAAGFDPDTAAWEATEAMNEKIRRKVACKQSPAAPSSSASPSRSRYEGFSSSSKRMPNACSQPRCATTRPPWLPTTSTNATTPPTQPGLNPGFVSELPAPASGASPGLTRKPRVPGTHTSMSYNDGRVHTKEAHDSSAIRLAPEVARAARALRAEGKELAHVLAELRRRCGPRVLRSQAGREATIRVAYVGRGNQQPEWTVIARLANAAGLKSAEVLPWSGGVRVCFLEEWPPSIADPDLPEKLHAHASALADALRGHHERAVTFFNLLAEHHLGPNVTCSVERSRDAEQNLREYASMEQAIAADLAPGSPGLHSA